MNLSRACALSCLMLGSPYPPGALEALAACARYLCGPAFTSDLAARVRAHQAWLRIEVDSHALWHVHDDEAEATAALAP